MKVSVVICTYSANRLTDLLTAAESVLCQRYQEKEIRLVGRGSYNHLSRSFVIDQAELTSGTLAGSASMNAWTSKGR